MDALDCTDIKVLLSGLVDDEVDADTRHAAERHLSACTDCRTLVNETETLNDMLVRDTEAFAPETVSAEFVGSVLGRTVYADARARRTRWTNWLGWMAAAAAVVLAASIWYLDRAPGAAELPVAEAPQPTNGARNAYLVSSVYEGTVAPSVVNDAIDLDDAAQSLRTGSAINRDDAETFDAVALLLDTLVRRSPTSTNAAELREIASYDDFIARLALAHARLTTEDQLTVDAAQSVLLQVVHPMPGADLQDLRTTVAQSRLADQLRKLSDRWYRNQPL